jgi:Zn-dependent peptidase ImmA (M78 family)/transcriptional regulator with XRE-family HTH domain
LTEVSLDQIDARKMGQALQGARKARGLTQEDVATQLGMARTTVTAIEKGERRIKASELIALAKLYARSVNELVGRPEPVEAFEPQFRAEMRRDDVLQHDAIVAALAEFERLCRDYLWLEELTGARLVRRYPPPYSRQGGTAEEAGEDVATCERNRLGLGDGPLPDLREILEADVGLRVFQWRLPAQVSGIYAYTDQLGGCIMVNLVHPQARRRWSLSHDFGHFLTDRYRPSVDSLAEAGRRPESERFADAFAMNFLMPCSSVRRRFRDVVETTGDFKTADLVQLAHTYAVSVEAMCLRLEQLCLIRPGAWGKLESGGFRVREAQQALGLDPAREESHAMPVRYQILAVRAHDAGQVSEGQLSGLLRCSRVEARILAESRRSVSGLAPDGRTAAWVLDTCASLPR